MTMHSDDSKSQATTYYFDSTDCATLVAYSGGDYTCGGHSYDSLESILDGIDYGDELPFKELSPSDLAACLRVLEVFYDYVSPVSSFVEDLEQILCSRARNVFELIYARIEGRQSIRSMSWDASGCKGASSSFTFFLVSLSDTFQLWQEHYAAVTASSQEQSPTPCVYQSRHDPLQLVPFDGETFWYGASAEKAIHYDSYTAISPTAAEAIRPALAWVVEDMAEHRGPLKALESILHLYQYEPQHELFLYPVTMESGTRKLEAFPRIIEAITTDSDAISDFFAFLNRIRVANARFQRAASRANLFSANSTGASD